MCTIIMAQKITTSNIQSELSHSSSFKVWKEQIELTTKLDSEHGLNYSDEIGRGPDDVMRSAQVDVVCGNQAEGDCCRRDRNRFCDRTVQNDVPSRR